MSLAAVAAVAEGAEESSPRRIVDRSLHFLLAPGTAYPLALFRIGIATLQLTLALVLSPYLLQLYGQLGFVQWPVGELVVFPWLPSIARLATVLVPMGLTPTGLVYGLYALYLVSLLGLLVGWKTRIMAIAAWLIHLTMLNSGFLSTYGVDLFSHISLFYCTWMPVGSCLSIDRWLQRAPAKPSAMARLALRTLQIHLCVVYVTAGMSKTAGEQWWNGEAIWLTVMQPQFAQFDFSWLASVPWVAMFLGWSVLLIELGYPFFIWHPRTRVVWLGATMALHLGIGLFLGLWFFAAIMVIMNGCAFGYSWLVEGEKLATPQVQGAVLSARN